MEKSWDNFKNSFDLLLKQTYSEVLNMKKKEKKTRKELEEALLRVQQLEDEAAKRSSGGHPYVEIPGLSPDIEEPARKRIKSEPVDELEVKKKEEEENKRREELEAKAVLYQERSKANETLASYYRSQNEILVAELIALKKKLQEATAAQAVRVDPEGRARSAHSIVKTEPL